MLKRIKLLFAINWYTTIRLNLKLKKREAIKLPIIVFGPVSTHSLGGDIYIQSKIIKSGMIEIGKTSVGIFEKRMKTVLNLHGTIVFKGTANIGNGSAISVGDNSYLEFGDKFKITAKSSIICSDKKKIIFGESNLLSWDTLIMNAEFHKIYEREGDDYPINVSEDIYIGDRVWIGCRCLILKGTSIPNDSVIAANSRISGCLKEANSIYTGMPVKILKNNIYWNH